jgi:hypothetical protein
MLRFFAGLALACLVTSPVFAQDATCANPVAPMLAQMAADPETTVADDIKVKSALFDEMIVVHYKGREFLWFAQGGCIVASPLLAGPLPGAAPAPATKPSSLRFDNTASL